ncbi:hypothetical protein C8R46DRAFT_1358359 [Mycena filopes]|nr:hypothetical protein C8R46DRAFT_1358359 [Mycena filopes]
MAPHTLAGAALSRPGVIRLHFPLLTSSLTFVLASSHVWPLFVVPFALGLSAPASASNSSIVCVAGQCLQGSSNTTLGVSLSASDVSNSVLLLPGQYTATTDPQLVHDLLTSSHATLIPNPGFGQFFSIYPTSQRRSEPRSLPSTPILSILARPPSVLFRRFQYPTALALQLSAESMALSSSIWVALSFGSNGRVIVWDSVPDTAQLPLGSVGSMSLLDMQSSTCSPPCASSGTCSSSGTCACAPGFNGTSCETCTAGFFGPTCQACPPGCSSC